MKRRNRGHHTPPRPHISGPKEVVATREEMTFLASWIGVITELTSQLHNALCDPDGLMIDAKAMIDASRQINIEACHVNALAREVQKEARKYHGYTDEPPF